MSFDFSKIQLFNEYTLPADCGDMQIKEYFLCGKKSAKTNEDGIFLSKNFAAIVDGATAKSKFTLNGKSTGKLAMELVIKAYLQNKIRIKTLTKIFHKPGLTYLSCSFKN